MAQQKRIRLGTMRLPVRSPALLSGLRIQCAVSCGLGYRCGSDLALLWLWCRLAAVAPIRPLAWELPYAASASLKNKTNKQTKVTAIFIESLLGSSAESYYIPYFPNNLFTNSSIDTEFHS